MDEKCLFFSTVDVDLGEFPGKFIEVTEENVVATTSKDSELVKISQERSKSCYSETYKMDMVIPYIPATDPKITPEKSISSKVPKELHLPLLQMEKGKYKAMKSGIRSSLLKVGEKFYRFKGCGNNNDVFPTRKVKGEEFFEIRGCMFECTAKRAIYMTKKFKEILEKEKITVANLPMGYYEYEMKEFKVDDVKKCCAVFQTFGDKRLNDHVILGLEKLLPFMTKVDGKILDLFEEKRRDEENIVHSTDIVCITGNDVFGEFVDLFDTKSFEYHLPEKTPEFIPEKWKKVWDKNVEILKKASIEKKEEFRYILPYLYYKMGMEIGKVVRLMHKGDSLWGTYFDHLGFHCNAHPNNLILMHERLDGNFLAPLDFDMAFTKESFIGKNEKFVDYMNTETNGMKIALAGGDINSGSKSYERFKDSNLELFRQALRDTMLKGFDIGIGEKKKDVHADFEGKIGDETLYALLTLALIVTSKDIA